MFMPVVSYSLCLMATGIGLHRFHKCDPLCYLLYGWCDMFNHVYLHMCIKLDTTWYNMSVGEEANAKSGCNSLG